MTDADDAGLVELTDRLREPVFEYAPGFGFALINEIARPDMCKAADLLEAQRREIVELRREIAEALRIIEPVASGECNLITCDNARAFAAKHGGRDG